MVQDVPRSRINEPEISARVTPTLRRNVHAVAERNRRKERSAPLSHQIAERITAFSGSMISVAAHLAIFGTWTVVNLDLTPIEPWDPSLVMLATFASVEAIFLSTFVLISQNRMSAAADRRAELDLQANLLAEHEISRLIEMIAAITRHLGIPTPADAEVQELKKDVTPEAILDEIERAEADEPAGETRDS